MSEWKPIDSAPKDGTRVLLWWPYWSSTAVIGWWEWEQWESDDAVATDGKPPLFWQPLPPPPEPAP